jgi:hypothetical protein
MDIQSKVAARRAELEESAREAQRTAANEARAREAAKQAQREEALEAIVADLSQDGVKVRRQGDHLDLAAAPLPILDIEGIRRTQVESLLKREARKLWTPAQNWQVIAPIVAGFFLLSLNGLGLLFILGGLVRRSALNKRYRAEVRQQHPVLFPAELAASAV